jgi:hypothetical protein
MSVLGWPAPAAGIVAALASMDRAESSPDRTPLLHSVAAAAFWTFLGGALALGFRPEALPGTALAFACGFGTCLLLDALSDRELYLWPPGRSPAGWLMPHRPQDLVQLDEELFVLPACDGSVPRPWGGWRIAAFRGRAAVRKRQSRAVETALRHGDLLLSMGSLSALLLAVVLK